MKCVLYGDGLSGKEVLVWEDVDRGKAHELLDEIADFAEDADQEELMLKIKSIKKQGGGEN